MEALGVAANVIAVIDISVKILQVCSQYGKEVKDARDDIEQFREEVADLQRVAKEVHQLINSPGGTKLKTSQDFAKTIEASESLLSELCDRLEPAPKGKLMRRIGLRSLKWPFQSKEIERILQRIKRCSDSTSLALQVDQTTVLLDVDSKMDKVDSHLVMQALPSAAGAAYNSYAEEHNSTCLKSTRVELLQEIDDWIDDHQAQTIFWLNGMAGTGKSTIARTIAASWDKRGYLGASFFFKRGEADRGNLSRFYTTVARQLVVSIPDLASHVRTAIEKDDSITTKAAAEQFDKLLLQPLLQVKVTDRAIVAIVIDALDECEGDGEIRQLIDLLTRSKNVLGIRIRVLMTSRPELPIRLGFNAIRGNYQDLILEDIPDSIITRDIAVFLEEKLGDIRRTYNASVDQDRRLADDWPGTKSTELLIERAIPLFIFAATVCRFISQRNCANPQKQLQKVLSYETKSQESKMDATYLPPLEQQLEELSLREQEEVINEFQQIVGPIVLLETPLSVSALARLIDISEETIYGRLDMLHSVLKFPKTSKSPIRLLHLSFRDFLLDPEKRGVNRFWIDAKQAHDRVAMGCLRVMEACLKKDICGLEVPGIERSEVPPECIVSCISMELQYACRYWALHLQEAESFVREEEEVFSFLKRHLLHWLEVLSLMGRSRESFRAIKILQTLAKDGPIKMLLDLLQDAHRFIQMNSVIIDLYPLQLYSSLLYCVPTSSIISSTFAKGKPEWMLQVPNPDSTWDRRQLILENKQSWEAEDLSIDDSRLACLSYNGTIRIWRLDTGECIREMHREIGPRRDGQQRSIRLCRTLMIITSIEGDEGDQLSLHCADTGALIERYDMSPVYSESVQISPDLEYIAFTSSKDKIVLLHLGTMDRPRQIYLNDSTSICDMILGPSHLPMPRASRHLPSDIPMPKVVFSIDSKFMAVVSGNTGRYAIWDLETCDCIRQHHEPSKTLLDILDCDDDIFPISFALDKQLSMMMAWSALDYPLRIEWLDSGKIILEVDGLDKGTDQTQFSPDNTIIAAISYHGPVGTWRIDTGECLSFSDFDYGRRLTTLSPDFQLVASQETDNTIVIERANSNEKAVTKSSIKSLVLSPDHKRVASDEADGDNRLWDVLTGDCSHNFIGWASYMQFTSNSQFLCVYHVSVPPSVAFDVWDVTTGKCFGRIQTTGTMLYEDVPFLQCHPAPEGIISPDARWMISSRKNRVFVWMSDEIKPHRRLTFQSEVYDMIFSPNSRFVVILSYETKYHNPNVTVEDNERTATRSIVSIESTEKDCSVATVKLSNYAVFILAVSPDSKLIALSMNDGHRRTNTWCVQVLRMDTGEKVCEFTSGYPTTRSGLFFRNSTALAWRENLTLVFIDITGGTLIQRLKIDFPHDTQRVDFQPDTHHVYTNFGAISLDRPIIEEDRGVISFHEHRSGCGISEDLSWLLWNKTKIFWLPPAFRPSSGDCVEVSGSTIFIGTRTKGVLCFKLDAERLSIRYPLCQEKRV